MKTNTTNLRTVKLLILFYLLFGNLTFAQTNIHDFAPKPPLGYNSFDSYRSDLTADKAYALIDVMAEKYLPFGYEYFVMDAGWYSSMNLSKHKGLGLESFGMCVVNPTHFPNGIKALINHAHKKGLKIGSNFFD